jgi:tetratricopeptide (TPR) repeat protein
MRCIILVLITFFSVTIFIVSCQNNGSVVENTTSKPDSMADPIAKLEKSIQAYPDSLLLIAKLSDLQEENGQLDLAFSTIEKGLQKDSTTVIFHNRKASLLLAKGDTSGAISGLLKSLSYAPEQTDIHVELGFLYAAQKKKNALMVADFLLTQTDQPALQTQARFMKGIYYVNIGDKKNALLNFNECIINDYTFIDAFMEKGILLYNDKKYTDAQKSFEKVLTISNTHTEAYFWTGKCLEAQNKKEEALDFYRKTLGLDDKMKEAAEGVERLTKTSK